MAEIITETGRKAIKKMAQISQCANALSLMPTPEDFALKFIGELRGIAKIMNRISTRIDEILDKYMSIPVEFLFEGLDLILEKLNNLDAFAKHAIEETSSLLTDTLTSASEMTAGLSSALSAATSATLQIGGGLTYGATALGANIALIASGDGRKSMANDVAQDVVDGKVAVGDIEQEFENRINESVGEINDAADAIRDWTTTAAQESVDKIGDFFGDWTDGIGTAKDGVKQATDWANQGVDNTLGVAIDAIENAKREIEEKVAQVKELFNNLTKNYQETFGFLAEGFTDISNTADGMEGKVFEAIGDLSDDIAKFIENFNIGKVVGAIGGIAAGAGLAAVAMELLPDIDVDKMVKRIVGGIDKRVVNKKEKLKRNKHSKNGPELEEVSLEIPFDVSEDDLEMYNSEAYDKFLEAQEEENNREREEILRKLREAPTTAEIRRISKENKEKMKNNKSALKEMRKIRRQAINAKMAKNYMKFLNAELEYLKTEMEKIGKNIKREWDFMMNQYKIAIAEITRFFTTDGCGGSEQIDRCCDRINKDATEIVELCQSITVEITNTVAMVPTPYAVGSCVDMPVHKILAFFKDVKIIITFLKNLITLGVDIVSQMSILAKIVANGMQSLSEVLQKLMDLIGIDKILKMIDFLIALFKPKMVDAKILIENSLSPVFYNETEEYEMKIEALEALLEDNKSGGNIEKFKYTDDPYAKDKYRKQVFGGGYYDDDEIEDLLEDLEAKGEREIVAYRSPILNAECDDFAGWIFYHAYAYDNMKKSWSDKKKRRRNRLIQKAAKKNKMVAGKLRGGVAQLKRNIFFGYYNDAGKYVANSVNGFDAYYWYTKWTSDPTDCEPDFSNVEVVYDEEGNPSWNTIEKNVVSPVQTTSNGSLVELSDGRRVFVEGKVVKSGDYVNVDGVKYRVK